MPTAKRKTPKRPSTRKAALAMKKRTARKPVAKKTYLVEWEDWATGTRMKSRVKATNAKDARMKVMWRDPQVVQRVFSVKLAPAKR